MVGHFETVEFTHLKFDSTFLVFVSIYVQHISSSNIAFSRSRLRNGLISHFGTVKYIIQFYTE